LKTVIKEEKEKEYRGFALRIAYGKRRKKVVKGEKLSGESKKGSGET